MEVIIFTLKYAGPLMVVGLYVLGWFKTWSRPDHAFVLIYAVGLFACFQFAAWFAPLQPPYAWSASGLHMWIDRFTLWGIVAAFAFAAPALGIVAIRRYLRPRA